MKQSGYGSCLTHELLEYQEQEKMILRMLLAVTVLVFSPLQRPVGTHDADKYKNLTDHMAHFAADSLRDRAAISRGDTLARTYIANQFAGYGLQPTPSDGTYFQWVPLLDTIAIDSACTVTCSTRNQALVLNRDSTFVVDSHSGSGHVDGEIVFLGYGIYSPEKGYSDYDDFSLVDKVAMCYLYPPKDCDPDIRTMAFKESFINKVKRIQSMGGKAVIFICPTGIDASRSRAGRLPQHLKQQDIPIIRISEDTAFRILAKAGMNMAPPGQSMASNPPRPFCMPNSRISLNIQLEYLYKNTCNVLGLLRGNDATRTVVIGAHYDTERDSAAAMNDAADDNSSGLATILEIARIFAQKSELPCNLLFIAFGAEEAGNVGSRFFVSNVPAGLGCIKAMLNFDMVGRMTDGILYIHQVRSAQEWQSILRSISTRDIDVRFGPDWSATDSGAFVRAGIPALWLYTGSHADRHARENNTPLNVIGMQRIVQYSLDLIECISSDAVTLTYQDSI